jgi:hypothetical protein
MHTQKFLFILLTVVFYSCSSTKEKQEYHENGNLKSSISFKNGIKEGKAYYYYENGTLEDERNYKNGKILGWRKVFYKNGQLNIEGFFIEDLKFGWLKKYNIDGELKQESEFLIVDLKGSYFDQIDTANVLGKNDYENQKIIYNNNLIDTLNSRFFTMNGTKGNMDKNNIYNKGDTISFELKLETPSFEKSSMNVYLYNNYPDLSKFETDGYSCSFSVIIDKDIYYLEGVIDETNMEDPKEHKKYIIRQPIRGR